MKQKLFTVLVTLAITGVAYAATMKTKGLGFIAPQVNGTANVDAPHKGEIVYDTSTSSFQGYSTSGTVSSWTPLSASSANNLPHGMVYTTAATTCPLGSLEADGSSLDTTTYADLYAAIGTTYGSVDGSHFNLPNIQGIFVRGAGSQTVGSITYTGTLGISENDQMQGHYHNISDPGHRHAFRWGNGGGASNFLNSGSIYNGSDSSQNGDSSSMTTTTGITVQSASGDGSHGTPRVGSETKPANISLLYCIVQ